MTASIMNLYYNIGNFVTININLTSLIHQIIS